MEWWRVKALANAVNGSTLLGLALARLGRAELAPGPRGLHVAVGYRLRVPVASAFTVGNVVLTRHGEGWLDRRPQMLRHEERHSWQYVACLGLPLVPLYLLAAGYSCLRGGDMAVHNVFEQWAGLTDGGYPLTDRRARLSQESRRAERRPVRTA